MAALETQMFSTPSRINAALRERAAYAQDWQAPLLMALSRLFPRDRRDVFVSSLVRTMRAEFAGHPPARLRAAAEAAFDGLPT